METTGNGANGFTGAAVAELEAVWDDGSDAGGDGGLGGAGRRPELLRAFGDLVDQAIGPIGRVVGSEREPAGNAAFAFWADEKALTLDVGHIVVAFSEEAAVIGVVDEPRRFSDVQSFLDDYFDRLGAEDLTALQATARPEMLVFTVRTLKTKHLRDDVDSHRPPLAGPVWFATKAAIEHALDTSKFTGFAVPALLHTNGNWQRDDAGAPCLDERGRPCFQRTPIWLDSHYLMGPEAGHANWTGQSGLATKTSHAIFLISSAFQQMRQAGESVAALMFNVKGSDLLWLDKAAEPDDTLREAYETAGARGLRRQDVADYAAFGMEPEPFRNLRIFAPFIPTMAPTERTTLAALPAHVLATSLNTYRNEPAETANLFPVVWTIDKLLWMAHRVFDRDDLDDKLFGLIADVREMNLRSLNEVIAVLSEGAELARQSDDGTWEGHNRYTVLKLRNRIQGLESKFGGLLAKGEVDFAGAAAVDGAFADQELRVVDIARCNSNVQELLVSGVVNEVWKKAELNQLGVDKLIVFVDELNKYAPAGGEGGLRDVLVDIAARGRHLNVVLFGAQQFRSRVDGEILGNCGTSFYGRVGDEEIVNAAYRSLSETVKGELMGLPKGRLLVRHAHFRAPLFGSFPMPPTIAGTQGQKVFNDAGAVKHQEPGDAIWSACKEFMGDKSPTQGEVRRAAVGLSPEQDQQIARSIREQANRPGLGAGFNPWHKAKGDIDRIRRRGR
jgi:hypothetical protein